MIIKIKKKNVIEEVDNSQEILRLQTKLKSLKLELENANARIKKIPEEIRIINQEITNLQNMPQETQKTEI